MSAAERQPSVEPGPSGRSEPRMPEAKGANGKDGAAFRARVNAARLRLVIDRRQGNSSPEWLKELASGKHA